MAMDDVMPKGEDGRRGLLAAEKAGRGGDRVIGHLTPGELVVPKSCQTPGVMQAFAKAAHAAGLDPNRFIVGSPEASKNPKTGLEEFDDGEGGEGEGGGPGDGDSDAGHDTNGIDGSARDTPATGDPDNSNTESGYGTNGIGPGSSGTLGYGDAVDAAANIGERAVDAATVDGHNLGVLGWGLGMVPGIGLGMMAAKGLSAVTGEKGVADYGDGMGGGSDTSSRVQELDPATQRARRRGLLSSRRV